MDADEPVFPEWIPPSVEGTTSEDQQILNFGQCTAVMSHAFETADVELFDQAAAAGRAIVVRRVP
jgi:hypothetical protein